MNKLEEENFLMISRGFISNPDERVLLKDQEYQEKIARGIDQYFVKKR